MLNKESILERTSGGLSVFKYYISFSFRVGRNFHNPLYEDRKASCNIYFDRNCNCYRMKDFGNEEYSGDCFFLVGKIKGLDCTRSDDFVEILKTINQDLCLGIDEKIGQNANQSKSQQLVIVPQMQNIVPANELKEKSFQIIEQPFSKSEMIFWQQYGVTRDILKKYNVISLRAFKSESNEGKTFQLEPTANEPIFGYVGKKFIKIYRPHSQLRFLYGGTVYENYCFGLEQLPSRGDILYITGGEKDVLSLCSHGFNAICFNSETAAIPDNTLRKLSFMFKHIVVLYDMDKTGQESSLKLAKKYNELGVKRLLLPLSGTKEEKDISDYFRMGNTADDFRILFLDLLDTLYSDTMSILKSCEVNFDNPPPQSKMVVSVNDVPLGTQGNLLCITGGEGTGKSNYVGSIISGCIISEERSIDCLGNTVSLNYKSKAVLLYDTEQSEVQLYKNCSTIIKRAGLTSMPNFFKAYSLTGMSRKQRLQSIVESMDKFYHQFGGIQLVVIDGVADLIKGANDEQESISIVEDIYRYAGIYNTCIICVLHFIPNGLKLRGHLGSELQRKAAAILSIEKDDDPAISVVKALKVRDGSPLDVPLMQFSWDKSKGMHTYMGEKPKEERDKRKESELVNVARTIFEKSPYRTYVDLCEQIQTLLDVKERTAKSYIKFMREKEIVIKDPSNTSYFIVGHLNTLSL
ncbi:MAG: topoisomerase [Bacteroidetes bacterium HGW-Bacteroidetes-7]|nr:MAG: topoisomerase [Bacteroidetes bacterium HGW-Bacteroidetes-7]